MKRSYNALQTLKDWILVQDMKRSQGNWHDSRNLTIYQDILIFLKGNFVVNKTKKVFSAIPIDQAHEQNKKCVKGDDGAVGPTETLKSSWGGRYVVQRWQG